MRCIERRAAILVIPYLTKKDGLCNPSQHQTKKSTKNPPKQAKPNLPIKSFLSRPPQIYINLPLPFVILTFHLPTKTLPSLNPRNPKTQTQTTQEMSRLRIARKLALTTKQVNKGYYKGTRTGSMGRHTSHGGYIIEPEKVRTYVVPERLGGDFKVCYSSLHVFLCFCLCGAGWLGR